MDKEEILDMVDKLIAMYKNGELGGEVMPEDANPHFESSSLENYLYFTLPIALNYQRNSYTLLESALKTYLDEETRFVFNPKICLEKFFEEVQFALTKYKVALQKQKQTEIWLSLFNTFVELFNGDMILWIMMWLKLEILCKKIMKRSFRIYLEQKYVIIGCM